MNALRELAVQPLGDRCGGGIAGSPFADAVQPHKHRAFVGAAVSERATGVEVCAAQGRLGGDGAAHLLHHGLGALQGGAFWQHHHPAQLAVVLLGNEGSGSKAEGNGREQQSQGEGDHQTAAMLQAAIEPTAVGLLQPFEPAPGRIDPAQQPGWFPLLGVQDPTGGHRREADGIDRGHQDGGADADGDRCIEPAHAPFQSEHWQKHHQQHQGGGHDRTAQLGHGSAGRSEGGIASFEAPSDVFAHHNRVVDHQAGGQHHPEQAEGVDRGAAQVEQGDGAEQRDRHRQGADQGQTAVAQA